MNEIMSSVNRDSLASFLPSCITFISFPYWSSYEFQAYVE
jgi:hypothetical protein